MKKMIKSLKLKAILSGVRKDEGRTRKDFKYREDRQGIVKFNPILDFTEVDIWKYFAVNKIPVHPWYAKGYRSLGCAPCTGLCDDRVGERDGRWKQSKTKCGGECQIHTLKLT